MARVIAIRDGCHFVLLVLVILTSVQGKCIPSGTTPEIRDLIIGRCLDFQTNINPDPFCKNGLSTQKNCTELADLFISSFAYKSNCNVSFSLYDDFIRAANHDVTSGRSLFWSGTGGFVHKYSNQGLRYTTLEDTLIGYLINELNFCGQEETPGIIFGRECAGFYPNENCSLPAMYSFWAMASKNFAASARGEATVMLNGSREEPFRSDSFFATWEVPNMDPSKVTRLNILLLNTPGLTIKSTCNSENISKLKQKLTAKTIDYHCVDSPRGPQTMLCVDYPDAKECQGDTTPNSANLHTTCFYFFILCIVFSLWM